MDYEKLIDDLKNSGKPDARFLSAKQVTALKYPDCLSIEMLVFRNGGEGDGGRAVPFVEGTPQLMALLRAIYS